MIDKLIQLGCSKEEILTALTIQNELSSTFNNDKGSISFGGDLLTIELDTDSFSEGDILVSHGEELVISGESEAIAGAYVYKAYPLSIKKTLQDINQPGSVWHKLTNNFTLKL